MAADLLSKRIATLALIKKCRGIVKSEPDDKPFAKQWAEHKRAEVELEEIKNARITGGSR